MSAQTDIEQAAADSKAAAGIMKAFTTADENTQVDNGLPGGIPSLAKWLKDIGEKSLGAGLGRIFSTKSDFTAALPSLTIGTWAEINADESLVGSPRTRYQIIDAGGGTPGAGPAAIQDRAYYGLAAGETEDGVVDTRYPPGNLLRYGALGQGVSSHGADTLAIQRAVAHINAQGYGKIYVPDTDGDFYAYSGPGELIEDFVEVCGDGMNKTRIRHVNPDAGNWYYGVVFYLGTYAAQNSQSIQVETSYPINDMPVGSDTVILDNVGDSANFSKGDLVVIVSGASYNHSGSPTITRYAYQETFEIIDVSTGELKLDEGVGDAITTSGGGASPKIFKLNTGKVSPMGKAHRMSRGLYIHDIAFEVAEVNEITGDPLANLPNSPLQLGCTYRSRIERVKITGYRGMSGNMWCRSTIDLDIESYYQIMDPGYGSHNTSFNIRWQGRESILGGARASLFYAHEGSHDLDIKILGAGLNWSGTNIAQLAGSGRRITLDIDLYLPAHSSANVALEMSDEDAACYVSGIDVKRYRLVVGAIGRWLRAIGASGGPANRRHVIRSTTFVGADQGSFSASMVDITRQDNIDLRGLTIPLGGVSLTDVTNSRLGIQAAASALATAGSFSGSDFNKGEFASSTLATTAYGGMAKVGTAMVSSIDVQAASARIYSQRATFSATNGVAVEFRSSAQLAPYIGGLLDVMATSDDGLTMAAAVVAISAAGNVVITATGSTAGAFSTDGQNLKYTNSSGNTKTVRWSIRAG